MSLLDRGLGMKTEILTAWKVETEAQRGVDTHLCVHIHTEVTLGQLSGALGFPI